VKPIIPTYISKPVIPSFNSTNSTNSTSNSTWTWNWDGVVINGTSNTLGAIITKISNTGLATVLFTTDINIPSNYT
jgi:hypothetical protein